MCTEQREPKYVLTVMQDMPHTWQCPFGLCAWHSSGLVANGARLAALGELVLPFPLLITRTSS